MKRAPRGVLVGLIALAALGGCAYESRPTEDDVREVAEQADGQVFYVGMSFDGLPLTHAESLPPDSPIATAFGYGSCDAPGDDGGCSLPLTIQSAVCPDGHTKVGIFGTNPFLKRAAVSLIPAGGGDAPAPEIVIDTGPLC